MNARRVGWILTAALVLRLVAVLVSNREVADVLRYRKVADHVLDVSWNPYEAPRLYPYPPVWVWAEAGSGFLNRHLGAPFPVLVKLPVVAADGLAVLTLAHFVGRRAAWAYALHPVSVLVTGFHGQFDALAMLFVILAVFWREGGHLDRSALALAGAIATKSYPVLLLPVLLLPVLLPAGERGTRWVLRYALLATVPVAAILTPYALANPAALARELLGYGGVADFGWTAAGRAFAWVRGGTLARSEAIHWPTAVLASRILFLSAYAVLVVALWRRNVVWSTRQAALGVLLLFLTTYGALSAQYLLWAVPLGLALGGRWNVAYCGLATTALVGFYLFLAPGVLLPPGQALMGARAAGTLWAAGVAGVLAACGLWFGALLRAGIGR